MLVQRSDRRVVESPKNAQKHLFADMSSTSYAAQVCASRQKGCDTMWLAMIIVTNLIVCTPYLVLGLIPFRELEVIKRGSLTVDVLASRAYIDDNDLFLTQKELALLYTLIQNEGQILSAKELYERVWNSPMNGDNKALKITLSRLRGKIEGSGFTVSFDKRQKGYSLVADEKLQEGDL